MEELMDQFNLKEESLSRIDEVVENLTETDPLEEEAFKNTKL